MPSHTALPIARRVPIADPLGALRALSGIPGPFLLHSALEDDRARWSFFGADPFSLVRGGDYAGGIAAFRRLARRVTEDDTHAGLVPFTGGVVGYWSYDFGRRLERLRAEPGAQAAIDDLGLPDFVLGFYDVVGVFDHGTRETWLFSSGLPFEGSKRADHAARRLDRFEWLLERGPTGRVGALQGGVMMRDALPADASMGGATTTLRAASNFRPDDYQRAIERVKEHIRSGDIFQANLSQRWTLPLASPEPEVTALALHEALARVSPAPYAAFLGCGDHAIASASPERFLERRGSRIETRPIKGTRPRHPDPAEDAKLRAELLASVKDRAENIMIVDVLRNDLGRVCEMGSIETPELCALESFPHVFHLTSTVTGRVAAGRDAFDALEACFPGGSITGAPKIRAMELLDAIEPHRRHLYTGSIGYVDWRGDADWNIAIRTAIVTRSAIHFSAGGGITADSDADAEYEETLHKAEGLRLALSELAGSVELEPSAVHSG
ncbi:MAG: anthranilate synthase component I family protein [Candidatus Eisenbacteria bacterium]|nr:anthranilate synthase component I family protein [Candidatus Eisenbacteria bacterium]